MRSRSLARVVMATLGVSVVITPGCGPFPPGPSPVPGTRPSPTRFSVQSISPPEGSIVGATVAKITGTGFQAGDTVTVDGIRVDATVLDATTISLTMPAHAAGKVNVTVINPLSPAQASVPGGFLYVGPPVIDAVVPNTGSTAGGMEVYITGTGVWNAATVTVDGISTPFEWAWPGDGLYLFSMPAHAAGTVEVVVTDPWGQAGRGEFTYASPATFDLNGDWEGLAEAPFEWVARVLFTIRNNRAVSVMCFVCRDEICAIGSAPSLTLDPPPVVANGEFSFAGSGGVSITGRILSPGHASGSLNMPSCGSRQWSAQRKQ